MSKFIERLKSITAELREIWDEMVIDTKKSIIRALSEEGATEPKKKKKDATAPVILSMVAGLVVVAVVLVKAKPDGGLKIARVYEVVNCQESSYVQEDRDLECAHLGSWCQALKSTSKTPAVCTPSGKRYKKLSDCAKAAAMTTLGPEAPAIATCFQMDDAASSH
jgi:hypothetical protein